MSYPRMEAVMEGYPGYEWEPITVITVDDYVLTLFHIWNPERRDAEKKVPILF